MRLSRGTKVNGGAVDFIFTADLALRRVIDQVRLDLKSLDKRRNPNQALLAAVRRLELLRRDLSR